MLVGSTRFIPDLEIELEKRAYKKSVSISDATAYTVALMKHISLTTFDVKPQTTLAEVVTFLNIASRTHDRHAKLHTGWNGVKIVLKTAKGEPVPTVPEVHGKRDVNVYNAVEFITKATGYDFEVKDKTVVIFKKGGAAKK